MVGFANSTNIKTLEIGGYSNWVWPKADTDHVFETLAHDWITKHGEAFLRHTGKKRKVCIQAGGNCGMYPLLLSSHFDRVYTFEPDAMNFHCLVNNCQKENILKFQMALGKKPGMAIVQRCCPSNIGAHIVLHGPAHVPVLMLDSLDLDACDFIQLDVEGQELQVLEGAENLIWKYRPVISAERAGDKITEYLEIFRYRPVETVIEDVIYRV